MFQDRNPRFSTNRYLNSSKNKEYKERRHDRIRDSISFRSGVSILSGLGSFYAAIGRGNTYTNFHEPSRDRLLKNIYNPVVNVTRRWKNRRERFAFSSETKGNLTVWRMFANSRTTCFVVSFGPLNVLRLLLLVEDRVIRTIVAINKREQPRTRLRLLFRDADVTHGREASLLELLPLVVLSPRSLKAARSFSTTMRIDSVSDRFPRREIIRRARRFSSRAGRKNAARRNFTLLLGKIQDPARRSG